MAKPQSLLLWCAPRGIRVYLTHQGITPSLVELSGQRPLGVYGYYYRRRVYINAGYSELDQNIALVHELLHASLRKRDKGGPPISDLTEERVVSAIDRELYACLIDLGLEIPPRPAGYAELARAGAALEAEARRAWKARRRAA